MLVKDHVFQLLRQLAIKDSQLFEYQKEQVRLTHLLKEASLKVDKYMTANFFLRESIKTIETRYNDLVAGGLAMDNIHLPSLGDKES